MSFDKLCELVEASFKNAIKKVKEPIETANEPTLIAAYAALTNTDVEETIYILRKATTVKTIQNAVGSLHQKILGNVEGWIDSGTRGGGFDIRSIGPVAGAQNRIVLMEVKMRWNTIKGTDEKYMHDKLFDAVKSNWGGEHDTVGYIAQIVPKNKESYDRPWKVSKREADERVRAVDGKTAYHLVTGRPNALDEVMSVFPHAFREVLTKKKLEHLDFSNEMDVRRLNDAMKFALPASSAYTSKP